MNYQIYQTENKADVSFDLIMTPDQFQKRFRDKLSNSSVIFLVENSKHTAPDACKQLFEQVCEEIVTLLRSLSKMELFTFDKVYTMIYDDDMSWIIGTVGEVESQLKEYPTSGKPSDISTSLDMLCSIFSEPTLQIKEVHILLIRFGPMTPKSNYNFGFLGDIFKQRKIKTTIYNIKEESAGTDIVRIQDHFTPDCVQDFQISAQQLFQSTTTISVCFKKISESILPSLDLKLIMGHFVIPYSTTDSNNNFHFQFNQKLDKCDLFDHILETRDFVETDKQQKINFIIKLKNKGKQQPAKINEEQKVEEKAPNKEPDQSVSLLHGVTHFIDQDLSQIKQDEEMSRIMQMESFLNQDVHPSIDDEELHPILKQMNPKQEEKKQPQISSTQINSQSQMPSIFGSTYLMSTQSDFLEQLLMHRTNTALKIGINSDVNSMSANLLARLEKCQKAQCQALNTAFVKMDEIVENVKIQAELRGYDLQVTKKTIEHETNTFMSIRTLTWSKINLPHEISNLEMDQLLNLLENKKSFKIKTRTEAERQKWKDTKMIFKAMSTIDVSETSAIQGSVIEHSILF